MRIVPPPNSGLSWAFIQIEVYEKTTHLSCICHQPFLAPKEEIWSRRFSEITYIPMGSTSGKNCEPRLNEKLVLAYLGNITTVKGADILLKELKHVKKRQNVKVFFYGKSLDGVYQNSLKHWHKISLTLIFPSMGHIKGTMLLREFLAGGSCGRFSLGVGGKPPTA